MDSEGLIEGGEGDRGTPGASIGGWRIPSYRVKLDMACDRKEKLRLIIACFFSFIPKNDSVPNKTIVITKHININLMTSGKSRKR